MNEVFISYSHQNEEIAQRIASKLKTKKIGHFLAPKGIDKGDEFKEKIRAALVDSHELWVIVSPDSLKSEWVMTECGAAWALNKRIVPILYQCPPKNLPNVIRDLHAVDFVDIGVLIKEFLSRRTTSAPDRSVTRRLRSSTFLFDIDGTVLNAADNLTEGVGSQFLAVLSKFAERGYRFVFITGNNYEIQKKRVLEPIIKHGLGSHVFCFTDGGSRAFEFNKKCVAFKEIESYASNNLLTTKQVKYVECVFRDALSTFMERPGNDTLKRPHIHWINRTLDFIDIGIFPLRPSFRQSDDFKTFCEDISPLFHDHSIKNAAFHLIQADDNTLIIRAHGKTPDIDASSLQDLITRTLMFKPEYCELSRPELEKRGGSVICQIALKPFNDEKKRGDFRRIIAERLEEKDPNGFSVLLGGRTTIDIQRKGVNKRKAIRFLIDERTFDPQSSIYFGNEFRLFGNDRSVAEMEDPFRPAMIVNVGEYLDDDDRIRGRTIDAGNGPRGTLNHLDFLLHQLT